MVKKFSFWVVFALSILIGGMVFIHWKTIQSFDQRAASVQPLYHRRKTVDSLMLSLERYRRMSSSFRKIEPGQIQEIKNKLRSDFAQGVNQLDQIEPTPEERVEQHTLNDEVGELLSVSAQLEQTLFSKDAYQKVEVQALHDEILKTLAALDKSTDLRLSQLHMGSARSELQSLILLLCVGTVIFFLMLSVILRSHFVYLRPLKRLHAYALDLKMGKQLHGDVPFFTGMYGEIQSALNQLAQGVETHMRDRHKFLLDIVADLKRPLEMLQSGKYLIGSARAPASHEEEIQATESVRRGLTLFSGSLDDLNDIVDINRLESRLEEKTVDLSELLSDVSRRLIGAELGKRVSITVPPIPVWTKIDARRFERVLVHVLLKVFQTLPAEGGLSLSISQVTQGPFRGVEVLIQDADRSKNGRNTLGGPEQEIVKHWMSESGLSLALSQKIIKAHGGSITAAGVAGTSVTVTIRLPQERIVSRGLISPPTDQVSAPGLVVQTASTPKERQSRT